MTCDTYMNQRTTQDTGASAMDEARPAPFPAAAKDDEQPPRQPQETPPLEEEECRVCRGPAEPEEG